LSFSFPPLNLIDYKHITVRQTINYKLYVYEIIITVNIIYLIMNKKKNVIHDETHFFVETWLAGVGLMMDSEKEILEAVEAKTAMTNYWIPLTWATNIINRARREKLISNDHMVQTILLEMSDMRYRLGSLIGYDNVNIPILYSQVGILYYIKSNVHNYTINYYIRVITTIGCTLYPGAGVFACISSVLQLLSIVYRVNTWFKYLYFRLLIL